MNHHHRKLTPAQRALRTKFSGDMKTLQRASRQAKELHAQIVALVDGDNPSQQDIKEATQKLGDLIRLRDTLQGRGSPVPLDEAIKALRSMQVTLAERLHAEPGAATNT